jgi:hypothetical protein
MPQSIASRWEGFGFTAGLDKFAKALPAIQSDVEAALGGSIS